MRFTETDELIVKVTGSTGTAGTPSTGVLTVQGITAGTPVIVGGEVAAAATDSGNPVKVGGKYSATSPTLTDGQRGNVQLSARGSVRVLPTGTQVNSADGRTATSIMLGDDGTGTASPFMVWGYNFNGSNLDRVRGDANGTVVTSALTSATWSYAAAASGIVSSTAGVTIKAAAGASVRNYLKTLTLDHDTLSAATEFVVRDGAAGTILWRGKLMTTAEQGRVIFFDPPLKGTANTLMEIAALSSVTGGIYVNASGYTGV